MASPAISDGLLIIRTPSTCGESASSTLRRQLLVTLV